MNLVCTFLLAILIGLPCSLNAQSAFTSAGGDASGQDGSVSFSLGQIAYQYLPGSNGSVSEGVQQSYSDMMVGVEYDRFLSSLMLYPNPVTTELMIRLGDEIAADVQDQISYEIQDLPGRIVARGFLPDHLNKIPVQHLQQGAYFLSISYKTTRITSYKFIKAE